jgi:hypothetical protein
VRDVRHQLAINRVPDLGLTEDLAEIEVQQTIEGPTSFRVRFAVDICDGDLTLLEDERLTPGQPDTEVTIFAFVDGESHVLVHGIITERQVSLTEGGAGSWLEVRGQDRRAAMNREERQLAHSGKASDIVDQILRSYGFDVDIGTTQIEYDEDGNTLNQTETDLAFIDKLAGRNGVRFWLDWSADTGLAGLQITETAHFRASPPRGEQNAAGIAPPVLLAPDEAPELRLNSGGGCSNLQSFELSANAEAPNRSGPIQRVNPNQGSVDETEVPEPSDAPLGEDPPSPTPRTRRVVTAGDANEARVQNQAALDDAAWSVQATAETSVHALGGLVTPHQVIRVTGGGRLNSGNYFVKAVAHAIDASDHKLRIELLRNALGGS